MATGDFCFPIPRRLPVIGDAALLWLLPASVYYSILLTAGSAGSLPRLITD